MTSGDVGSGSSRLREEDVRQAGDPDARRVLRRQLAEAAVGLFVKQGYHETTTRDIAQAAGWTVGALYEYVSAKGDILYHVCEELLEETGRLMGALAAAGLPADAALRAAMETYLRACDVKQDVILLIYQESNCLSPDLRALVMKSEERITSGFEELILRGVREGAFAPGSDKAARLAAHNIVVLGQMWAFRRWYFQKHYTLDEYIAAQTDAIMRGLLPR